MGVTRSNGTTAERESRLNRALAEFLEAEEIGQAPDPSQLLAQHPDLARELKEFLDNRAELAGLGEPLPESTAVIPPTAPPADRVGDYELLGEIVRGGMGVVYRVRQLTVNRDVALKMVLAGGAASAAVLKRFQIEAEAAANLDHPNIVPIYDVGEIKGRPYFTMKLIEGGSLAGRLDEFCLAVRDGADRAVRRGARTVATHRRARGGRRAGGSPRPSARHPAPRSEAG